MTTDQDQTVIDTDTVREEMSDTDPTGVEDPTEVAEPIVVAAPTEENREEEDKYNSKLTNRRQKDKDRRSAHFDINKYLPEFRRYRP